MWNFHLTDLGELWNGAGLVLLIGFATAGLAFAVGWTTMRRRKAPPPAPAATLDVPGDDADPFNTGGARERRSAARRGGHPVTVELTDPDEELPSQQGWVMDRSVGGLCLRVPNAVPAGTFWKVRPVESARTTPPVRIEIRTCVPVGSDWKLNCQFEKTPSYAVLLMFG